MINLNDYRKNIYHKEGIRECPHYSEDGVILKIFEKIEVNKQPLIIEFGETRSLGTTTRSFRIQFLSKAIYFTGDLNFKSYLLNIIDIFKVSFTRKSPRYLKFLLNLPFKYFVTPNNILKLLNSKKVKKIDILTIDIDSYDYYIAEKILKEGFKPSLLILEYNPSLPFYSKLTCPYESIKIKPKNKRIYGASFMALYDLANTFGYELVHISGFCNLFFVDKLNSKYFLKPNIEDELPKNNDEVMNFVKKYCQKDFIPSWIIDPALTNEDLIYFDKL